MKYSDFELVIASANLARHIDISSISYRNYGNLALFSLNKINSGDESVEKWLHHTEE
ncbi:hypothetical protein [Candidatus Gromoviella agglomerans]|uniref:hypothetical protein n=1 Tax=Candidatus Gromoviella agglomerans TaxID=2806609 RepID=UPI001E418422|nr:hypothetical protein [Candidatus Gromoviella agglomerans]UFX98218.1 hypothetical protein Gromo_00099 [Candidatus Gromoviella agglomerans]